VTQFQQSASVQTLDTPQRGFTAPFLAITAGLIAVLMAVAVISFAVDARPSDTAGYADTAAGNAYAAGLNAAITQHQAGSAQRQAEQWAAAAIVTRSQSLNDGWEAAQIRHGQAMRDLVKRVPTAE
jgi:Tfp pilus assembly major pilin PilA